MTKTAPALLTCALTVLVAACAQQPQKPSAQTTLEPTSLNSHDNAVATPSTPLPSLPPLTHSEKMELAWHDRGWSEIASTQSRVYLGTNQGLQAVRATNGDVIWRNRECIPASETLSVIGNELFFSCSPGTLTVLSADTGRILRSAPMPMHALNGVVAAGQEWLAVQGWDDGAALVNRLVIVRRDTLKQITNDVISDGTFLGVIGDRAYIDDWCCHGRADEYRPATIYSISLRDGSQSDPVDLTPDRDKHPARLQPLGQGEHNYMRGHYLYVPVDNVLYRYDILHLNLPPSRRSKINRKGANASAMNGLPSSIH